MKRLITYSCMAIFAMGSMAQNQKDEAQMNRFISGLMKKMTLEEKVGQLSQCSGGFATGPDNTRISRTEDISKGLIDPLSIASRSKLAASANGNGKPVLYP